MTEPVRGIVAMVVVCAIWGLSPIYYRALSGVPPLEVLAHRTLWSLAFFGAVLAVQGRLGLVRRLLAGPGRGLVALAAGAISVNWFLFILAVSSGRTIESSLGYYIFPLVAVVLGVLAFGERLARTQRLAVGLAAVAVAGLTWGLGAAPVLSLAIAFSFGLYGLFKKRLDAGPVVSVTAEVVLLAPVALAGLVALHAGFWAEAAGTGQFGAGWAVSLLLIGSGPLTAVPLMLFSFAARRASYAAIGLTQYLNPTLQFAVAVVIFGEPFGPWHALAFPLIWAALALYSVEVVRQDRLSRRARSRAATSPTTPM